MADTVICENAVVEYSIIDENTIIGAKAKIGSPKTSGDGIALLGRNINVESGAVVKGGAMIDKDVYKEDK